MPKVSTLPSITTLANTDEIYAVDVGTPNTSKKITYENLKIAINTNIVTNAITNATGAGITVTSNEENVKFLLNPNTGSALRFDINEEISSAESVLFRIQSRTDSGGSSSVQVGSNNFVVVNSAQFFSGATFNNSITGTSATFTGNVVAQNTVDTGRITNYNNANLDVVIEDGAIDFSLKPPSSSGTTAFIIQEDLLSANNELLRLNTKAFNGGGNSECNVETDALNVNSTSVDFSQLHDMTVTMTPTAGNRREILFREDESSVIRNLVRLQSSETVGGFVSTLTVDANTTDINGGTCNLDSTNINVNGTTFNLNSDNVLIDNNVNIRRSDSTTNIALFLENEFQANGNTTGDNSIISRFERGDTGSLYDAGRIGFKKSGDYQNSSNATTDFRIQNSAGGSGNQVTATSSSNGNFTISGTYSPFTGTHIARFGSNEQMPNFAAGLLVEIQSATPNRFDDNDFVIDICNTPNSFSCLGVLLAEEVVQIDIDALFAEDPETRKEAFVNVGEARNKKVDFWRRNALSTPETVNGIPFRVPKPPKLDGIREQTFYIYRVMALGEGSMWVTNANGNIRSGDYITAYFEGYAQRQDPIDIGAGTLIHVAQNITVAKAKADEDFTSGFTTVILDGRPVRAKQVPVSFMTG